MTDSALDDTSRRKPVRWLRIVLVLVVVAGLVAIAALVIPQAIKPRANAAACDRFASIYSDYVTAALKAKSVGGAPALQKATDLLPAQIERAAKSATGDVKDALKSSHTAAVAHAENLSSVESTLAFFSSATNVARVCDADGSTIHLRQLS